jgi:hypothetical protein
MIRKLLPTAIVGYFLLFIVVTGIWWYVWAVYKSTPSQPIAFPHKTHVSKVGLECTFCHEYADKSPRAGVPPVQKCMSCHTVIAKEKPEIKKLRGYWDRKEPIPWNRVYELRIRKYVHFTHKRHIKAGIDCSMCHGDVGTMSRIRKVRSLEMGWCITCHHSRSAPTDCLTCHR